jgi:hypothetical protein
MVTLDSLEIFSINYDFKINAHNIAFELSKSDYLSIAKEIKDNNELQRKTVIKRSSSVYSLMQKDLKDGCLIPPIVLSLEYDEENKNIFDLKNKEEIKKYIITNYLKIKILDGLQRTNMLLDVHESYKSTHQLNTEQHETSNFYKNNLRFEIYIGANRFGILYRMLTLNTGQTPMTITHQMEMLYADLYKEKKNNIILTRERDSESGNKKASLGTYKFYDMIEGMESYLQEDEFITDRFDILEYVKNMEKISKIKSNKDTFELFVETYHSFIEKVNLLFGDVKFEKDKLGKEEFHLFLGKKAFGETAIDIFTRSQAITGFGAAISNKEIKDAAAEIQKISLDSSPQEALDTLIIRLAEMGNTARGIGSSQRKFFKDFFFYLFDATEANFVIEKAVEKSFKIKSVPKSKL